MPYIKKADRVNNPNVTNNPNRGNGGFINRLQTENATQKETITKLRSVLSELVLDQYLKDKGV